MITEAKNLVRGMAQIGGFVALLATVFVATVFVAPANAADGDPPAISEQAPDFTLSSIDGKKVTLSEVAKDGPVVLIVLRGYPGYQCPICSIQVGDLLKNANEFKNAKARVLLVYPGPSQELVAKAKEFLGKKSIPEHFTMVVDPDYKFTNAYHLRWDAPRETAYPSAFVIDEHGKVRYAQVSKTHGGRAKAADLLKTIAELP